MMSWGKNVRLDFDFCIVGGGAITLPNGFTFDETKYLDLKSRTNYALEKCEDAAAGCSNDCSTQLICDGRYNVIDLYPCQSYCVQNNTDTPTCSGNFPMSNPACVTRAINNFVCTEDGQFPDPTDGSKYHVCKGSSHSIEECPASHHFISDGNREDMYMNPGSGQFSCRFRNEYEACVYDIFDCNRTPNAFVFRYADYFHYAYCLQIGTTTKVVMFKCPSGSRHRGWNWNSPTAASVECIPFGTQI
ncbi:hypothetical protein HA402_009238 [Bradysia odoriphaga]|nr:hypothetical protein HA402_009238 [Bradysia odoriphaga]